MAVACSAFAARGTEISAPSQDIGEQVKKQDRTAPTPKRTSGNRFDFGDEYGTAKVVNRGTPGAHSLGWGDGGDGEPAT